MKGPKKTVKCDKACDAKMTPTQAKKDIAADRKLLGSKVAKKPGKK